MKVVKADPAPAEMAKLNEKLVEGLKAHPGKRRKAGVARHKKRILSDTRVGKHKQVRAVPVEPYIPVDQWLAPSDLAPVHLATVLKEAAKTK